MKLREQAFGTLGYEVKRDVYNKDLDAKIIITSHNSRPGLGKTTLAIKMARDFDRGDWDAESKAFMDAHNYQNAYAKLPKKSALVFDEIEGEADSRRGTSTKNVELSQAWAQNRYRNMITICTLPSVNMLDKRMIEMSDYWINVIDRGMAHPYRVLVNDFDGSVYRDRIDDNAVIRFTDLPNGDDDYQLLKQQKHRRRTADGNKKYLSEAEHKEELNKKIEVKKRAYRDEWIRALAAETDMTYQNIADLSVVDVRQPRVSNIVNEKNAAKH